jgi:inhibitor of Bruton tyrosine kinase
MSTLHAYFALRNQQAFQRTLEGLRGSGSISHQASTSAGKAPNTATRGTPLSVVEVNSRDWLGRTVLHLACASTEPSAIEYVRMLLSHPAININLQDSESHWTALHRALYNGHIAAA